eukprot:m.10615 g.10615  ORF g.10615 m.10615 type:complete len:1079 (-) comp4294_c0_seq1:91-3327(-)
MFLSFLLFLSLTIAAQGQPSIETRDGELTYVLEQGKQLSVQEVSSDGSVVSKATPIVTENGFPNQMEKHGVVSEDTLPGLLDMDGVVNKTNIPSVLKETTSVIHEEDLAAMLDEATTTGKVNGIVLNSPPASKSEMVDALAMVATKQSVNESLQQMHKDVAETIDASTKSQLSQMEKLTQNLLIRIWENTAVPNAHKAVEETMEEEVAPGLLGVSLYDTPGHHTWKRKPGTKRIKVYVTGGGGGGGSHNSDDAQGGGGGGGTCIQFYDVTNIDHVQVEVGYGGFGGWGNTAAGGLSGTKSTFLECIGYGGTRTFNWGVGGNGGSASGGVFNIPGGHGHTGNIDGRTNGDAGGNGGDSYWGGGGAGATHWADRRPGFSGGGGGGNYWSRNNMEQLGKGGDGVVVVEEYGQPYREFPAREALTSMPTPSADNLDRARALEASLLQGQLKLALSSLGGRGLVGLKMDSSPGTKTYKRSPKVTHIRVYVTGGGGGGGSHNTDDAQGGGGAGGTCIKLIDVRDMPSITYVVGAGGKGSTGNTPRGGSNGGTSSFGGKMCVGTGGLIVPTWGAGGEGGAAYNGDINLKGGFGHTGNIDSSGNSDAAGNGGDSYWGGGGAGATHWGNRRPGFLGGGGGGNHASRNQATSLGNGGNGVIVIEEYSGAPVAFAAVAVGNAGGLGDNLAPKGTAFGSGSLTGYCSDIKATDDASNQTGFHCVGNINDGKDGVKNSWIPQKTGKAFVGIRFKEPLTLKGFAFSRDATSSTSDRNNGFKVIQVTASANPGKSTSDSEWIDVHAAISTTVGNLNGEFKAPNEKKVYYTVAGNLVITAIRVILLDNNDAIDEFSVYGTGKDASRAVEQRLIDVEKAYDALQDDLSNRNMYTGPLGMQVFTKAGAFTWNKPSGVNKIKIYVTGGGAGGGSHNTDDAQGGGGAGSTCIRLLDVSTIKSIKGVVGSGGLGGTGNRPVSGTNGGTSTFGGCSAGGGRIVPTWGLGGNGGRATATGDALLIPGGYGHCGNIDGHDNYEAGGNGGSSFWTPGGSGASYWGNRRPGRLGSGGGGNHARRSDTSSTGNGGVGVVVIEYYP